MAASGLTNSLLSSTSLSSTHRPNSATNNAFLPCRISLPRSHFCSKKLSSFSIHCSLDASAQNPQEETTPIELRYPAFPTVMDINQIREILPHRFCRTVPCKKFLIRATAPGVGSSSPNSDLNPYEVIGVNPIEGFEKAKQVYARKRKEAEKAGDDATVSQLEKAYDKLIMAQLANRKQGMTFSSFKVSKDIKYADKQPMVPWGPRFAKSSVNDMRINLAISVAFTAWILIKRNAEYKPLQFLAFAFVYRILEKLKSFEPPASPTYTEEGEDDGRALRMGKRLLRSLALVFGCMAFASLAYTGVLNLIELAGSFIPTFLYNNQELIVTTSTAVLLYITASYYR